MNKYVDYLMHPTKLILALSAHGLLPILSDRKYIELMFKYRMGYTLNLNNPVTYNEKLQWLKLFDHDPLHSLLCDKFEAKKYISNLIGDEYIVPTLGVWDSFDKIDFDALPNQFVLKCTHDSSGLVICKDKKTLDIPLARKKINHSLAMDYFLISREWPYKNIKPRIIAEKFLGDNIHDYKFFCFNGVPKFMYIATNEGLKKTSTVKSGKSKVELQIDYYDMNFNHLPFIRVYPNATCKLEKPKSFEKMQEIARKLSSGMIHVRVDLYNIDGKIYFGEMTFFTGSGFSAFTPQKWDYIFGDCIKLPIANNC